MQYFQWFSSNKIPSSMVKYRSTDLTDDRCEGTQRPCLQGVPSQIFTSIVTRKFAVLKKLTRMAYCVVKIHEIFVICLYFSRGQIKCCWFYWELIFHHLKILWIDQPSFNCIKEKTICYQNYKFHQVFDSSMPWKANNHSTLCFNFFLVTDHSFQIIHKKQV